MKKITFLLLAVSLSCIAATPIADKKKELSVTFSFNQWNSKFNAVVKAIDLLRKSDIPSKIANPVIDSLLVFQEEVSSQVAKQLADSTGSKKK